jgi:dUTP pyrophosphatase
MSKFEIVKRFTEENKSINLPTRATAHAAGYDFEVCEDTIVPSYSNLIKLMDDFVAKKIPYSLDDIKKISKMTNIKPTLVPTGIKCKLAPDQYLEISVRSSTPLNSWLILANGVGIIDSDYYENSNNDGEIFFQMINLSPVDILLRKGDKIGQGIIKSFDITENDNATGERNGGFGSTTE